MLTPPRTRVGIEVPTRPICCYHCFHEFRVAETARSHSCPRCSRRVELDDLVVSDATYQGALLTCGRVYVGAKARVVAHKPVHAGEGVEVAGSVDGAIHSAGGVTFHRCSTYGGDCRASSLTIHEGASVRGFFEIGPAEPKPAPASPDVVPQPREITLDSGVPAWNPTPLSRALSAMSRRLGRQAHEFAGSTGG